MIVITIEKISIYRFVLHKTGLDIYVLVSMIPDISKKPLIMRVVSLPFKFNKTFTEEHKKMDSDKVWSLEIFDSSDVKLSEETRHLHDKI